MAFVDVAKSAEIKAGELVSFDVNGVTVAVANVDGNFYAFDNVCTHQHCSLANGDLDGSAVVCPCHGSSFDVATGAVLSPPAVEPVKTYPLRVENGTIGIQVE